MTQFIDYINSHITLIPRQLIQQISMGGCTFILVLFVGVMYYFDLLPINGINSNSFEGLGLIYSILVLVKRLLFTAIVEYIPFLSFLSSFSFFTILYYIYTILLCIGNVAYQLWQFDQRMRGPQILKIHEILIRFGLTLVLPFVINSIFLNWNVNIYLVMPFNLAMWSLTLNRTRKQYLILRNFIAYIFLFAMCYEIRNYFDKFVGLLQN